jgi:hypothetical protein
MALVLHTAPLLYEAHQVYNHHGHDMPRSDANRFFESNNNIYALYMSRVIHGFLASQISGKVSFKGIKLSYVVDYLQYAYNFRPMEIALKTGSKRLKELESTNIIDYIDKHVIKGRNWKPRYDIKDRELSLLDFNQHEVIECGFSDSEDDDDNNDDNDDINYLLRRLNRERVVKIDIGWGHISEDFFCDAENHYQNNDNQHIEYSIRKRCARKSYNHIIYDRDFLMAADCGYDNSISYNIALNKFTIRGKPTKCGIIKLFEREFGIGVPKGEYIKTIKGDKYYEVNDGYNYITYDFENIHISKYALRAGLKELFEKTFETKIPVTSEQCSRLFKQKRRGSLKRSIKEVTFKYFLNLDTIGRHSVLQLGSDQRVQIVDRYREPTYNHDIDINQHGLYIKSKVKGDQNVINSLVIKTCKEAINSLDELHTVNFGQKLSPYCLTVETPGLVTVYSSGPVETTSSYFSSGGYSKFTATDTLTGNRALDIEMYNDKDFSVLTATKDYITDSGELIVWKGVNIGSNDINKAVGIARLIIPKHAWVAQNTEGMKFRTSECKVTNIYKVKVYKCIRCNNCGVFQYNGLLYCGGCALLIIRELKVEGLTGENPIKLIDIRQFPEVDLAKAPFYTFEYRKNKVIKIGDFVMRRSNCNEPGIYFFFRLEHVFNYMFQPQHDQFEIEMKDLSNSLNDLKNLPEHNDDQLEGKIQVVNSPNDSVHNNQSDIEMKDLSVHNNESERENLLQDKDSIELAEINNSNSVLHKRKRVSNTKSSAISLTRSSTRSSTAKSDHDNACLIS